MKSILLSVLCLVLSLSCFAAKVYTPNTNASISGAATYCQNATASVLTYTYNTCNTGSGTSVGADLTITWYSNTINSTSGGSMESVTFVPSSLTATGSTTFLPSTTTVGTTYYYCIITWDGTGTCKTSGTLTSAVTSVTVNTAPDVIAGTLNGCVGTVTTLTNTVPGGTWTSATVAKATINSSTGAVSAVAAGTSVISYTIGTCRSTATFTVNANPAAITGTNTVCEGSITTFTDATAGGTWSSDATSIATVNASNPVGITGVLAGTANISYTLATGCYAVRAVTVNTAPAAIAGTLTACSGTLTTLTNTVPGGTWTSATVAKATITASTGIVSAVAAGTSLISYTIGTCRSTATFTVLGSPAAITGTNTVCEGAVTTFTDATAGGTWSTSAPSTASVNASNPVGVTGVLAGTATITYTLANSCFATRGVTVNTAPAAISGTLNACLGNQSTLTNTVPGGTWTSATPARATIDAGGVVYTVSAGTSVISYTIGTCRSTATFTVNSNPVAITGTNTVCEGLVTTFTDGSAGGTWSSSAPSVASVNASNPVGITGVLAGTATITYTLPTSCFVTRAVTVNPSPAAITGTTNACVGVLTTLSNSVAGGTWTSATTTKATITSGGVVTPVSAGTSVISYTLGTCRSTVTFTVNATPTVITGTNTVCQGAVTTFTNAVAGGTWTIVDPTVATVNASSPVGITGLNAGSTTVSYTIGTCAVGRSLTVNTAPAAITGVTNACVGVLTTLSNSVAGGTWTSSITSRATITTDGVVTPVAAGNSTISYSIGACRSTVTFTVNTTPLAITGTNTVCEGAITTLSNGIAGGTWSITDPSVATINASSPVGVTGLLAGATTVSYTIGTCAVGRALTVNQSPTAITGTTNACVGVLTTLSSTPSGGTWFSSTAAKATINSSGVVTPVSAGTTLISYTVGSCRSTALFTVNTTPAAITGTTTVCQYTTTTLSNAVAGGTWTTNNSSIATVDANSPVGVTGVSPGSTIISYTIGTCAVGRTVTITTGTTPITGTTNACLGVLTTLSSTPSGGTWSSSVTAKATISSGGVVTPVSAGTTVISYTLGSCRSTATFTVNTTPVAITGTNTVCQYSTTTFSDAVPSGVWSTSDESIATIDASSPVVITAVAPGSTTISYTIGTCSVGRTITVNTAPTPITGTPNACVGFTTTLASTPLGGIWSSATSATATVGSDGVVSAVAEGSSVISYSIGSCNSSVTFSVNPNPSAITGINSVCEGAATTFTNTTGGGTWSSDNSSIATVDGSAPVGISGVLAGTTTISYTLPTSCYATRSLTVNPQPVAITGTNYTCEGSVTTLSDATGIGVWSSSNTSIATVNSSTGAVTGVLAGVASISYTLGSCYTSTGFTTVGAPGAISGVSSICLGTTTTFTTSGIMGSWSSNDPLVASVDASTGVVTGISAGSTTITYSNGCGTPAVKAIDIHTVPNMPADITGTFSFCTGTVSTLADITPAGTWSSTNTSTVTIGAGGVATGVAAGTATISYTVTNECGTTATTQDVTVVDYPTAVIASAPSACLNYATTIVFSGTPGATITYVVDGGAGVTNVLSGGSFSLSSGIVTSSHTYELVEVHNATCTTTYDTTATITPIPMQWVGGDFGHETEWERAQNWSCGFMPGDTTDVIIPSGALYNPHISSARVVYAKSLTIGAGASVSADATAYLYVKGALSNNGTFTGDGTLSMNGTSAQAITGIGNVSNLEQNNSAGSTIGIGSRVTIVKSITMMAGTLTTNDSLTLASDSVATARVAPITFGSSISGNVRVMQYIPGGYRRYRFWSHPFTSTISLSQVEQYLDITGQGGSTNGFTTTTTNNPSCYRYNPLVGNSSLGSDPGWKPFTKINALAADSNTFHRYQGIRLFFRGVKGQGLGFVTDIVDPNVIGMFGTLNQGEQVVPLVKGTGSYRDYNMVGNPYASPVDIGTVCYNAKNAGKIVGTAFYVFNPFLGVSGQFETITIGTGSATPYYLQANTSFQVRAANNGDALTFNESNKGVAPTTNLLKSSPDGISLVIYDGEYHPWDKLAVKFNQAATVNEDNDFDAQKLQGGDLNFYSLSADASKLAIDTRPFSGESIIPLGINTRFNKDYIIKSESVITPDNSPLYLHDKLLNKYVLLEDGTEYKFNVNENAASQGDGRFELSMKPGVAQTFAASVSLAPNPATNEVTISYSGSKEENVAVRVLDITGVCVYNKDCGVMQFGNIKVSLKDLSSGIYMVEVTAGGNKSVHRLVKE